MSHPNGLVNDGILQTDQEDAVTGNGGWFSHGTSESELLLHALEVCRTLRKLELRLECKVTRRTTRQPCFDQGSPG